MNKNEKILIPVTILVIVAFVIILFFSRCNCQSELNTISDLNTQVTNQSQAMEILKERNRQCENNFSLISGRLEKQTIANQKYSQLVGKDIASDEVNGTLFIAISPLYYFLLLIGLGLSFKFHLFEFKIECLSPKNQTILIKIICIMVFIFLIVLLLLIFLSPLWQLLNGYVSS